MKKSIKDRTNIKYHKLTALEYVRLDKQGAIWKCICDCGVYCEVSGFALQVGHKKSCGCSSKENQFRLEKGISGFNRLYKDLELRARKKNLAFTLTKEQVMELSKKSCYYCNSAPKTIYQHSKATPGLTAAGRLYGSYVYNGLDRINNELGYTRDNVLPCCGTCNKLRNRFLSVEETIEVIKLLKQLRNTEDIWKNCN